MNRGADGIAMDSIKVRFIEKSTGELDGFEVHTAPGHPIHERVSRALERLQLRIARRDTRTDESGSRQRVSVVSKDGGPIRATTRLQLQALLLRSATAKPPPVRTAPVRTAPVRTAMDDSTCLVVEPPADV